MATKKKSEPKTIAELEVTSDENARPADLRYHGDGSGMLDRKHLEAIHGADVIAENERVAREHRRKNAH